MKEDVLERVKPARREFLKKLLLGSAFASPVIATFSVEALMPNPAYALPNNAPCIVPVALAPTAAPAIGPGPSSYLAPVPLAPAAPTIAPFPTCSPYPNFGG